MIVPLVWRPTLSLLIGTIGVTVFSLFLICMLIAAMKFHEFGWTWRACSEDLKMASLCGVHVDQTLAITFVIASLYASAAGSLIALLYGSVSFTMGQMIGLKTLFIAVIGGLTSFAGAVLGAFLLGLLRDCLPGRSRFLGSTADPNFETGRVF
ncbi:MAG: hypothetical protein JKX94_02415 [Sneathiella sp.]|nr:hypothetical protein [Sneathiella sp.]